MTILGWNQPIYICNDFPLFLAFVIILMNMQLCKYDTMHIWPCNERPVSYLYISTIFSNLRLKAAEILLILYVYPHSLTIFLMFS